jgi:hypothetical protein
VKTAFSKYEDSEGSGYLHPAEKLAIDQVDLIEKRFLTGGPCGTSPHVEACRTATNPRAEVPRTAACLLATLTDDNMID